MEKPTKELLILGVLSIVAILLRGYRYRITFMLPYSYHYLDPTLFSRDLAFFNYDLNFFFIANAYLSKVIPFEHLFFIGYLLSSFLLAAGVYYLAKTLFKSEKVAYLAVLLTIFAKPALSAMTTVWNYYYYKDLAMGLLLISLTLFLQRRYLLSLILVGMVSQFHILFALYFTALYGFILLFTFWKKEKAEQKKIVVGALALCLLLIAPVYLILSSEQSGVTSTPAQFDQWLSILKLRSFDHFFPSTWLTNSVILFLPILILFLLFLYFSKQKDFPAHEYHKELFLLFGFVIILGVFALIFSDLWPIRFLIITQLLRPTILLTFFTIFFSAYLIYTLWQDYINTKQFYAAFLASLFFTSFFYYDFRLLMLSLPLLFLYLYKEKIKHSILLCNVYLAFMIMVFVGSIYSLANPSFLLLSFFGEQVLRFNTLSYILLPVGVLGLWLSKRRFVSERAVFGGMFMIVLLAGLGFALYDASLHSDDPCYRSDGKAHWQEHLQYPTFTKTPFYQLSLWAKDHTSKDALFMIPVECGEFRNVAQRSVFLDFKYGTMSTFSIDFGLKWFERVKALSPQRSHTYHTFYSDFVRDYAALSQEQVHTLASQYSIDYAIFEKPKTLEFPIAYENEQYVMYSLQ